MNEGIENLALEKSFEQLGEAERAEVLTEMPPEAYNQLHALLSAAPALDPGPGPDAILRARLLTYMAGSAVTAKGRAFSITWWQAAAAVVLAVAATLFFQKPVVREVPAIVIQRQVDTVIIEKPLWREKVLFRYRTVPVAQAPVNPADSTRAIISPGASLETEPGLMQFFVQVR